MEIKKVLIAKSEYKKLKKNGLENSYKKAKSNILLGNLKAVDFKKRRPYKSEKYYFRVNKKFRAISYIENNNLYVFEINNHQ